MQLTMTSRTWQIIERGITWKCNHLMSGKTESACCHFINTCSKVSINKISVSYDLGGRKRWEGLNIRP